MSGQLCIDPSMGGAVDRNISPLGAMGSLKSQNRNEHTGIAASGTRFDHPALNDSTVFDQWQWGIHQVQCMAPPFEPLVGLL